MWYEIIPCVAVLGTLLWIPHPWFYLVNKVSQNRHAYTRDWQENDHYFGMFSRDKRLTGWEYRVNGLETLPDPSPAEKSESSV